MKDEEVFKIIAEKVMGWTWGVVEVVNGKPTLSAWLDSQGSVCHRGDFNPLDDDKDCMMAWDEFSQKRLSTLRMMRLGWEAGWYSENGALRAEGDLHRRRAMCECMIKAVSEE